MLYNSYQVCIWISYFIVQANHYFFSSCSSKIELPYHYINQNLIFKINPSLLFCSNLNYKNNRNFHTRCRAINRIGPHNIDIISVIFGLLLGDSYANNKSGEGVRISIKQSSIHKDYLFSLYEFFFNRGYCSNLEPRKYTRTINNFNKIYYGFEFNTFTFRSLGWIYNSFYKKGKKILPLNINKYMTPLTLAI